MEYKNITINHFVQHSCFTACYISYLSFLFELNGLKQYLSY